MGLKKPRSLQPTTMIDIYINTIKTTSLFSFDLISNYKYLYCLKVIFKIESSLHCIRKEVQTTEHPWAPQTDLRSLLFRMIAYQIEIIFMPNVTSPLNNETPNLHIQFLFYFWFSENVTSFLSLQSRFYAINKQYLRLWLQVVFSIF